MEQPVSTDLAMTDRYSAFDRLLFDRPAPHVLRVTINNPDKMNALDGEVMHGPAVKALAPHGADETRSEKDQATLSA